MKVLTLYILALLGGMFLAIQAGFNSQLGTMLKQPILAVIATSISSVLFGGLAFFIMGKGAVNTGVLNQVPWYLWLIGGLFSMTGITLYFYTIPKLGISKMIALGLCGQVIFSMVAGQYGWLNLPEEPLTKKRIIGALIMITGIILVNTKQ